METALTWLKSYKWYVLITFIFVVMIVFFNDGAILNQLKVSNKISALQAEKQEYLRKILELQKEQKANFGNISATEKFAREHYYMKKPSEAVYVIVDENNKPVRVKEKQ